jgi:hypothetical protein
MSAKIPRPLVLWRFKDGKPGHEKQTQGLCDALARRTTVRILEIPVERGWKNLLHWLTGRFPAGHDLPAPDLLIGAGQATHLPLLAARRAFGGRTVVLMRPSLPLALFDLCLIPEHDAPPRRANVIPTLGALNNLIPQGRHVPDQGLILVGGPSGHFQWDSRAVARQIGELVRTRTDMAWTLTTSRRTPPEFLGHLDAAPLELCPVETTPPGWLEDRLHRAGEAWVTPDSVSMVYEALTAGCRVGLFDLPARPGSRVARGVMDLKSKGYVSAFPSGPDRPVVAGVILNEADRCARIILEKWFP